MKDHFNEKRIKKIAIIIAIAFWPVSVVSGGIAGEHIGKEAEWISFLVTSILGLASFMALWAMELRELNADKTVPLIKRMLLSFLLLIIYMGMPAFIVGSNYIMVRIMPYDYDMSDRVSKIFVATWMIVGIVSCAAFALLLGSKGKRIKADQLYIGDVNYEAWIEGFLQKAELPYGYMVYQKKKLEEFEFTFCVQSLLFNTLNCIAIVRSKEVTDGLVDRVENEITKALQDYYGSKAFNGYVNMIGVFCVDRVSPAFYKLVNSCVQQGIKNGRFVAGVSFGGKQAYLAKPESDIFAQKYKELRTQFMNMAGLNIK